MQAIEILFLAVGVFDKGGIARYCRYQVRALRELLGEKNVHVVSLLGAGTDDFEEPFSVAYCANGIGIGSKLKFLVAGLRRSFSRGPAVIWSSHVRFLPEALALRVASPNASVATNIYGEELWSGWRLPVNRRLLPRMDVVISDCQFSADFVVRDYGVSAERLRVIWDCVDLGRFCPRPRRSDLLTAFGVPVRPENRYVLTLGRISKRSRYKGYDRLLDALASLRDYRDIIVLLAGDGDDRARLEARVHDEELEDRAFFLGSVSEALLADVYNLCDVFALVSDRGPGRGEGLPLTPLEAAACGKPIIVGDEDGSQEAVIDGVNGRVVSPRDAGALRGALLALSLDDSLRVRMGREARERIEKEFSYEIFRDKTAQVLEALNSGRGKARVAAG